MKSRYTYIQKAKKKRSIDGIQYKSSLEAQIARLLKNYNLFEGYENETFTLMNSWRFEHPCFEGGKLKKSHAVRAIKYTPDFVGKTFIIEAKGYPDEKFPLKWKLFKLHLKVNKDKRMLFLVKNIKEAKKAITVILENNQASPK